jgi:DNA-binding PadR family transcriptional regulator
VGGEGGEGIVSKEVLGGFEHQVMLAVLRLGGEAYTVPVVNELERLTGRAVAPAAAYVTLRRLEDRELLSSLLVSPEGGGRPVRTFALLPAGLELLRRSKRVFEGFWDGVSALEEA